MADTDETTKITETLYQHNLELAVKNKTLLLLEQLYQTSILTLTPEVMAGKITDTILRDLSLEFAGIFLFQKESDSLLPLALSKSKRLDETLGKFGFIFTDTKISDTFQHDFFKLVLYSKHGNITNSLDEIWGKLVSPEKLEQIKKESHIRTMLLYPLMTGADVLGVLLLGLNRDYETLNTFEKDSIKSFINVIALALDKVYLYKKVQDTNESLKELIKQRESLVHLVTHKVKGSFTRSKYIFAGIVDGTFGEINDEVKKRAQQGLDSDNMGIETVDLVLNADNMQKGIIKYDMKTIDFKQMVLQTVEEKRGPIEAKGLKVETDIKDGTYNVLGDTIWLKEVVHNLIENSTKYTKEGKIVVGLERKDDKVLLSVKDSGIGINEDDKKNLFTEGGRGKDSIKVNVDSTGYGLYSIKLIVEKHGGKVWAESEGTGKGSQFYVELTAI